MRKIKKPTVLEMLARMEGIVKKLPGDVRIGRLFIVDDGQGLVLEKGIQSAAEALGKTVEAYPGYNEDVMMLRFKLGDMTICELTKKALIHDTVGIKELEEVVRCRNCIKRGTSECAMNYRCSVCGGQWSWESDDDFCSMGKCE